MHEAITNMVLTSIEVAQTTEFKPSIDFATNSDSIHLYVFEVEVDGDFKDSKIVASGSVYGLTTEEGILRFEHLYNFLKELAKRKTLPTELLLGSTNSIRTYPAEW